MLIENPKKMGVELEFEKLKTISNGSLYDVSCVSEASLVRLVLNALQGVQSAVLSIQQLSALLCSHPADRSGHRIPTLWNTSLSTFALGKMLKSFGFGGSLVILLRKFVDFFTDSNLAGTTKSETAGENIIQGNDLGHAPQSLVNQAFSVAVRTVLEGYLCALDTISSSVNLRRSFHDVMPVSKSSGQGSLISISHSEVTLLEIYLHTKELKSQIEVLGYLCHLSDAARCFSVTSFEDVFSKADMEILNFPRGGNLLTYLYRQLQVVDPGHCSLLKFLFLRSLEPYCNFIRSWIYEAKISDPYGEFVIDCPADPSFYSLGKADVPVDFPLASVREQDGVAIPCFLRDGLVPLLRAGQQLQMVMKLLRLCNYVHAGDDTFEDILPSSSDFRCNEISGSVLSFNKGEIESILLSRKKFYSKMHEKLDKFMGSLDIKHRQVVLHDAASIYTGYMGGNVDVPNSTLDETLASTSAEFSKQDSEVSSMEDFSYALDPLESSECSSFDDLDEQVDPAHSLDYHDSWVRSKQSCLSFLCFSSLPSKKVLQEVSQGEKLSFVQDDVMDPCSGKIFISEHDVPCKELVELLGPPVSEIPYSDELPPLGWPVGGLPRNPLISDQIHRDDRFLQISGVDKFLSMPGSVPKKNLVHNNVCQQNEYPASSSYLIQSWNAKYSSNILSMNPMLSRKAFIYDASKPKDMSFKISESFPCFDFITATNPVKVCKRRFSGHEVFPSDSEISAVGNVDVGVRGEKVDDVPSHRDLLDHGGASLNSNYNAVVCPEQARGGSGWQVLLSGSIRVDNCTNKKHELGKEAMFEMPLDFIIDKCLMQEIMLQYIYVSRLSIKLLKEGFDLHEHFHALRRYHFMEIADWADLFVTSLWRHKCYVTEADKKIPEIQGLLEISIQRSSCERDYNKDRLYVYVKDPNMTHFPTSALGLHSFDFIGLGYRVDWPITIVLTSSVLRIYAQIFTYLIQLKLAVLSLTNVWCSLKNYKLLISETGEQHHLSSNFNCVVKLRHQLDHFVSTLQQYVLSQLSDVSWCKFCYSLKHEVKDMMDLESVHMAYLTDSLRICFLTDESVSISNNIEKILQCALDFRSCLDKGLGDVGSNNQGLIGHMSNVNITQALSINKIFDENLKELHSAYLKSPTHGEIGLTRFWSYLNYNEYYSDSLGNNMFK